jgi:cystathionine gamma-lyase
MSFRLVFWIFCLAMLRMGNEATSRFRVDAPLLLAPITLGIDVVADSMTEYLTGHSDLLGGCATGLQPMIDATRRGKFTGLASGAASVFDAFLITKILQTLDLGIRRATTKAMAIVKFLERWPPVQKV